LDGQTEALKRIAAEAEAKTGFLNLGMLGLTSQPDELFALTHLRALHLGDGFLSFGGHEARNWSLEEGSPNAVEADMQRLPSLPGLAALSLDLPRKSSGLTAHASSPLTKSVLAELGEF
jgi:hypothetical protein